MPIPITCPSCNGKFNAPDAAAGKKGKCPSCGGIIPIPLAAPVEDVYEAEDFGYRPFDDDDFNPPTPSEPPETDDRKPCPKCGERIAREALRCRWCGEVFDPALRKQAKKRKSRSYAPDDDSDLSTVDWILCIFCGTIACILGIVYAVQGKPKGLKMILVTIVIGFILNIFGVILGMLARQ